MANGERYTDVLAQVRDRLLGVDARLKGIDDRITMESDATREDIAALRRVVNEEQAKQNERLGTVEKYVAIRSSIERALVWGIGITVSVAGVACAVLKLMLG